MGSAKSTEKPADKTTELPTLTVRPRGAFPMRVWWRRQPCRMPTSSAVLVVERAGAWAGVDGADLLLSDGAASQMALDRRCDSVCARKALVGIRFGAVRTAGEAALEYEIAGNGSGLNLIR
jgi:hypothetical protein